MSLSSTLTQWHSSMGDSLKLEKSVPAHGFAVSAFSVRCSVSGSSRDVSEGVSPGRDMPSPSPLRPRRAHRITVYRIARWFTSVSICSPQPSLGILVSFWYCFARAGPQVHWAVSSDGWSPQVCSHTAGTPRAPRLCLHLVSPHLCLCLPNFTALTQWGIVLGRAMEHGGLPQCPISPHSHNGNCFPQITPGRPGSWMVE